LLCYLHNVRLCLYVSRTIMEIVEKKINIWGHTRHNSSPLKFIMPEWPEKKCIVNFHFKAKHNLISSLTVLNFIPVPIVKIPFVEIILYFSPFTHAQIIVLCPVDIHHLYLHQLNLTRSEISKWTCVWPTVFAQTIFFDFSDKGLSIIL
jgi:hypothetical protein